MNLMLSAQSGDVTTWRAVESFVAAFRQSLLALAATEKCGNAEMLFMRTSAALDATIAAHLQLLKLLNGLIEKASSAAATELKELTASFYDHLYRHFGLFHSVPAFYQLSMTFLQKTSGAIIAQATAEIGQSARTLPELTLIAVGPAGRGEYSPFCVLQLLLVHGEVTPSQQEAIGRFCASLQKGFEAAGLTLDPTITPSNPEWRGSLAEWRQRCLDGLDSQEDEDLINLCRLVDQYPLYQANGYAAEFKQTCSTILGTNSPAVTNLIKRVGALSNGLGLMGRLKLERSGRQRGLFRLLDHGLLPFSAAMSALALLTECREVSSCERIRGLLKRDKLDVEVAERMLTAWHTLHGLRLWRDQAYKIDGWDDLSSCLNPNEFTVEQRQSLIEALESVAMMQRHVEIIFSEIEE